MCRLSSEGVLQARRRDNDTNLAREAVHHYGVGRVSVTGLVEGLYILHHGELTAVGGRFFYARHLENVVFDLGGLPLRP